VAPSSTQPTYTAFGLLREWNYDEDYDQEDNVRLSIIIEGHGRYTVYLYPSLTRKSVNEAFRETERARFREKRGKHQQELVAQQSFRRHFRSDTGAAAHRLFFAAHDPNEPLLLCACLETDDPQKPRILFDTGILKWHCKYVRRSRLTNEDLETLHDRATAE
jgi:hypothetical protein